VGPSGPRSCKPNGTRTKLSARPLHFDIINECRGDKCRTGARRVVNLKVTNRHARARPPFRVRFKYSSIQSLILVNGFLRLNMRRKRARGRVPASQSTPATWSSAAVRWAHCEWFVSWLDAPFFECSEFNEVLESMGLFPDGGIATRAEWGRLRAAMCNAFEAYAAPRRLSQSYLQMERRDLELYRADARAAMRGKRLPAANDPVSGAPFKPEWYARYRHPPPYVPDPDSKLIVKVGGQLRSATFVSLSDGSSIHSNHFVRVRFSDSNQVTEVPDLDVMLHEEPLIPHCASDAIPNASDVAMEEGSNAIPLSTGMRTPPGTRRVSFVSAPNTPLLAGVGNNAISHHHLRNRRGSIFNPLVSLSPRPNGSLPNTANLNDEDDGHHHHTNHPNSPGNVMEAEVDVGRLATLMRLVDQRQAVVETLRRANETGEEEMRTTGAITNATRSTIESSVTSLADLSARSEQLLPSLQQQHQPRESPFTLPRIQPTPSPAPAPAPSPIHPLQPSPAAASPNLSLPFETHLQSHSQQHRVVQKLEDAFTDVLPTPTIPTPPPSARRTDQGAAVSNPGLSPRANTAYPTNIINMNNNSNVHINLNNHHDNNNDNVNIEGGSSGIPERNGHGPSPGVVAATRGIDSNSTEGSIRYGKAITNACIEKYSKFDKINNMPLQHRSDVVDCVSVCVALLHRARVTKDPDAIDQLIAILRGRFPNFPDTIQNANLELRRQQQYRHRNRQEHQTGQQLQPYRKQQFHGTNHHQQHQVHYNTPSQGSSAAGPSGGIKARTLQ